MTGPYESILGRKIDRVTDATITFRPTPFQVATEDRRIGGAIVDVDPDTGTATAINRVMIDEQKATELQTICGTPSSPTVS